MIKERQLTHISNILARREYKKSKKGKANLSKGWTLKEGVWTNPKVRYAWVAKSSLEVGTYVAQAMTDEGYIAFNHGFKSLDQAIGWIMYGKKVKA